jgi:hypothetical protein
MRTYNTIFDYIQSEEKRYQSGKIPLNEHWDWNMREHITLTELYMNAQLKNGKNDWTPVKNITLPVLNLQHRTEDIDVNDVQIYVDDPEKYHLSFLVKKYHDDVFVPKNKLDQFFDDLNVSRIDYGAGLSKKLSGPCPEVVPLQTIAFCDQTDMLSGPIGIKHFYSPDQLLDMSKRGWGEKSSGADVSLEDLIRLSREDKKEEVNGQITQTPGRYIEIYEVHGNLPKRFTDPHDTSEKYETRLWIVAFYQKKDAPEKGGVVLYSALEDESPFKVIKRDPIHGRALGRGGGEELFEPQVWVTYDMIRMQAMLDAASKTILKSTDPAVAKRNKVKDMENLDIIDLAPGTDISQIDTYPRNLRLFEKSIVDWENHAKDLGAAQDPVQGKEPSSGTPFKSLEEQIRQGMGLHEYRRKQYAKHLEEIYMDWIIPHIAKEITKGAKFLSELSMKELQWVTERTVECETQKMIKEKILNGEEINEQMEEEYRALVKEQFMKKGTKHFIEILKGEFKSAPLAVKVSIAGSKQLAAMVDKIVNIFRFALANPQGFAQVMQIPGMGESWNKILEFSGLSQVDFSGMDDFLKKMQEQAAPPPQPVQPGQPMQQPQPAY